MEFRQEKNALICRRRGETLRIEGWGKDSLRIRATMERSFTGNDWALSEKTENTDIRIEINEEYSSISNGRMKAVVNAWGVVSYYDNDRLILREYYRNYDGTISKESRCLRMNAREYRPWTGGDYRIIQKFESDPEEKIFGMGQYQQANTDLKGCILDLEQRNSQISVPFYVSSIGYGFLWNNPCTGRVSFGMNITEWDGSASKEFDYWITAGDSPKEILENYTAVTGRAPAYPENMMGLWQCKLRYRTQEEVLKVVHECVEKKVPIDCIVIDFFHWTYQGDWKFDPVYWPDPKAMIDEIHSLGIKVIVSVWPSVDKKSENFHEMQERGLLIRTERGSDETYEYQGDCVQIDATNEETRNFVWEICRKNYYDLGIDGFWLDNSEPDLVKYDFDNFRYSIGPAMECSNLYPQMYSRLFFDHMKEEGQKDIVNLLRSCWCGSQKYANVVWSGDVPSTFESLRDQLQCGINMGLAGIPWWTSDIGGFMTDDWQSEEFKELLVRWFEFAVYTAVLRMHGNRGPNDIEPLDERDWGGGYLYTGHDNELWSYGSEVEGILRKQLNQRLELKPYIKTLFEEAEENGSPLLRAMFYEFPEDEQCWNTYDQYMFGSKYLSAPVLEYGMRERQVYLPSGYQWKDIRNGQVYEGGQTIVSPAPLDSIPVFERM